jgi:hypothetical protein
MIDEVGRGREIPHHLPGIVDRNARRIEAAESAKIGPHAAAIDKRSGTIEARHLPRGIDRRAD